MRHVAIRHEADPKIAILPIAGYAVLLLFGLGTAAAILFGVAWGVVVAGGTMMAAMAFGRLVRTLEVDPLNFVAGTMATVLVFAVTAAGAMTL